MANPKPSPETRFGAGNRANPRGMTKAQAAQRDALRATALGMSDAALAYLARVVETGEGNAVAKAAADSILNRGLGKPSQEVSLEVIERERDEMRRVMQAWTDALAPFPEAKVACLAALEPYLEAAAEEPANSFAPKLTPAEEEAQFRKAIGASGPGAT